MLTLIKEYLLSYTFTYKLLTSIVLSPDVRRSIVKRYIRPKENDIILDIGCGPADVLEYLPGSVKYVGFDSNGKYIKNAKRRFKSRGQFICLDLNNRLPETFTSYDIVLAFGVLHHLNDKEAMRLLEFSFSVLKHGGRLVTFDNCYMDDQSCIARYIISKDRGRYVRKESQYKNLVSQCFSNFKTTIHHDLLRIPYTHIIIECVK